MMTHPEAYAVSVVEQFERIVAEFPDRIAIQCGEVAWTYNELNLRVNGLASELLENAIPGTEAVVALWMERSEWTCVCMLATWKARMVYLPLSLENPASRNLEILKMAGPQIVIHGAEGSDDLQWVKELVGCHILSLANVRNSEEIKPNPGHLPDGGELAYLMFTSGSTGKPKGVMIEHAGMLNHLYAKRLDFEIGSNAIVAQNASQSFDISIWQFLAALLSGGKTVVYPRSVVLNPLAFLEAMHHDGVTVLELVPSYFSLLLKYMLAAPDRFRFPALKYLVLNAEILPMALVEKWLRLCPGIPIVNTYGATETSDDAGHFVMRNLPDFESVPVAAGAIVNHSILVLDGDQKPCIPGAIGEIYIAGIGVGRGYLGEEVATNAAFMLNPWSKYPERMYKTGDLGRLWDDGTLEFCGRRDRQVKIDGQRVELDEVEQAFTAHPDVIHAVVVCSESEGRNPRLKGFWIARNPVGREVMRNFLDGKLPGYMIPSVLEELTAFPINSNEKIDLLALRDWK
ncbi:MAG: amino acid adenylation domain-containing protein [Bacteroidia bacterium]